MPRCLVLVTLLSVVVLACTASISPVQPNLRSAVPTTRQPPGTIEWSVAAENEGSDDVVLSILLQLSAADGTARSRLLTFSAEATTEQVVDTVAPIIAKRGAHCSVIEERGAAVDAGKPLAPVLQSHAQEDGSNTLSLSCTPSARTRLSEDTGRVRSTSLPPQRFSFRHFVAQPFRGEELRAQNEQRRQLTGEQKEYPLEAAELVGAEWSGVWGWISSFLKYHWGKMHAYPQYDGQTQTGRWHVNTGAVLYPGSTFGPESNEPVRLAIAADWAAGTREADYVQAVMMNGNGTAYNTHWTLHLGDIYYVGAPEYVNSNCLGIPPEGVQKGVSWPHGSIGSLAVQGNHEAYDRSYGFFDNFLPTLGVADASGKMSGQQAGFASLENAYWRVIMLDTGYNTYSIIPLDDNKNNTQPQAVMDWLLNVVNISDPTDTRGIIFLSHHQVESAFDSNVSQATPNQIASVLPPGRQVLWLFGHEHRLSFYKMKRLALNEVGVYSRCIGNGGFPSNMSPIPIRANSSGLQAYDDRQYTIETGIFNVSVTYNGFVRMELSKNGAMLVYSSLATDPTTGELSPTLQTDLVQELFEVDQSGDVVLSSFSILDEGMTVISNH